MWSLNYCCCYCLEDKEMSLTGIKERGNKKMNIYIEKNLVLEKEF